MTILEQEDRKYEENRQWYHPSTKFHFTIEEVFETLDTADVEMSAAHFMIEPIVNRNICNTFHQHNRPDQPQQLHKTTGQQFKPI